MSSSSASSSESPSPVATDGPTYSISDIINGTVPAGRPTGTAGVEVVEESLSSALESLYAEGAANHEIMLPITNQLNRILQSAKFQKEYHVKHPDRMLNCKKFNKVQASTIEHMGLTTKVLPAAETDLFGKIKKDLDRREVHQVIKDSWDDSIRRDSLIENLLFQRMVLTGGRVVIIILVCDVEELYSKLELNPVRLNGFEATYDPNAPAEIEYQGDKFWATLLFGKFEAVNIFFSQPTGVQVRKELDVKEANDYPYQLAGLLEDSNFKKLNANDGGFFILYAERDAVLEDLVNETLAKCVVLAKELGKRQITWCLSSGFEWIFGVLTSDVSERKCYRTDIIKLDGMKGADSVFLTLAYWGMTPPQDIIDVLESGVEA